MWIPATFDSGHLGQNKGLRSCPSKYDILSCSENRSTEFQELPQGKGAVDSTIDLQMWARPQTLSGRQQADWWPKANSSPTRCPVGPTTHKTFLCPYRYLTNGTFVYISRLPICCQNGMIPKWWPSARAVLGCSFRRALAPQLPMSPLGTIYPWPYSHIALERLCGHRGRNVPLGAQIPCCHILPLQMEQKVSTF